MFHYTNNYTFRPRTVVIEVLVEADAELVRITAAWRGGYKQSKCKQLWQYVWNFTIMSTE